MGFETSTFAENERATESNLKKFFTQPRAVTVRRILIAT